MPWSVPLAIAACTLATWVPGLPLALLALRRTGANLTVVLVTAAGAGLGVWLAVGIPAVHQGWFDRGPLALAVGLIAAAAWVPARRHVALLRPGRPGPLAGVLGVLAVVGVALRLSPVYFAYQVADFGEYVNRGNVIADGGPFGGWFVNGFPLMMAEANLLLGEARTAHVMPFLGLLVAAGVLAVLRLLGASPLVVGAVAVPFALHVHAVWFSQFPASETLYAALLVVAVLLAVAALIARDHATAAAAGAFGFLLVVTRGNGLVYLPVVALGLALVPAFVDAAHSAVLRTHFAALGAGLWLGTLYDARHNPTYFLDEQAVPRLPGPLADVIGRLDELPVAALVTPAVLLGLGAAAGVGVGLERVRAHPLGLRLLRVGAVGFVALAVLAAHVAVITPDSYLPRYEVLGVVVWAAVALALVVWFGDLVDDGVRRFAIGWPLVTGLAMATFQATRMRKSMSVDAPWFLYWDRYFFSEAFPMLLLAGAVAAAALLARQAAGGRTRPVLLGAGAVLLVVGLVDMVPPTLRATERPMFEDTYGELASIVALMPEPLPIVYDGFDELPEGWFWPNSSRVLADPIHQTFQRWVLNPVHALADDPKPDDRKIHALLERADAQGAYVVQVSATGAWRSVDDPTLDAEVAGEVLLRLERLEGRSAVPPEDQRWIISEVHVRVLRVSAAETAV